MEPTTRVHALTDSEARDLERLYNTTVNADVRTRCQIVVLSNWGHTPAEIAELTLCDVGEVVYWLSRYECKGLRAIEEHPEP